MKKLLILILTLLMATGCISINNTEITDLVKAVQASKLELYNQSRTGYKYYLPAHFNMEETLDTNEVFLARDYQFYMYVDLVSYFKKTPFTYDISENSYLSMDISNEQGIGYLEVNVKQSQYLIEIMYNYAKIEVIVDEFYLKEAITNALIILSTIKYNDDIIKNLMEGNVLSFSEEPLNIFTTNRGESDFLQDLEDYDIYEGDDGLPDRDKIK